MANLHIIDQSLRSHGGHHFDYVRCIAEAASAQDIPTFIATHRLFGMESQSKRKPTKSNVTNMDAANQSECRSLESLATVKRCFRNTTYQRESYLAGLQHLKRGNSPWINASEKPKSFLKRAIEKFHAGKFRLKRRKLIAQFANDCNHYFRSIHVRKMSSDDHVFLTTVSELEMMGLAIFLANTPWTRPANWHLQFHYNLLDGRTPEYDAQADTVRRVRSCFLAAMSRIPDHNVHFYVTSDELKQQYDRLGLLEMACLPYPISPRFTPMQSSRQSIVAFPTAETKTDSRQKTDPEVKTNSKEQAEPIRMVCPGELRREKGCASYLQDIVTSLWDDYLASGRLQLALQRPRKRWYRKDKLKLQLPSLPDDESRAPVVEYLRHPLSESDYSQLIRGSDCGLLFYDSRAYYSRRAGVLGEMLACGKPVIVPAGCWLAHQLQESQFQHVEELSSSLKRSRSLRLADLNYDSSNVPFSGGLVSFDQKRHPFKVDFSVDEGESIAIISFDWHDPTSRGVDARITAVQTGPEGFCRTAIQVVGHRESTGKVHAIFRIEAPANVVRIEFENAFHDSMATIKRLQVDLHCTEDPSSIPLSRVGIIAAEESQIANSIIEMVEHLDHYRTTAEAFSKKWHDAHRPARTVNHLLANRKKSRKVA